MSDSKPLISVIVRCFNREDTLGRALESIFQQSYDRLEVILIDDGSTDQSRTIAHQFENVRYFYQENQGLAGARESGLKRSTGKYVAFLDADDFWKPNFIEDSVSALEHLGCDFVFSNWATEGPGKSHQERLQLDRVSYLNHYKANSRDGW